jgi:hypothetical protein
MNPFQKKKTRNGEQDPPSSIRSSRASPTPPANYRSFADDEGEHPSQPNMTMTPVSTAATLDHDANFRGFSTSIYDMFSRPEHERVDCCALTCCGMLQSDRDRFLLTGVTPPGPLKRCGVHILLPICIFILAGFGATHVQDVLMNQIISTGLIILVVVYFFSQIYKGRSKRINIRKDLLWTKYQILQNRQQDLSHVLDQERPEDDDDNQVEYYLGQAKWDFQCAHPLCVVGCYPDDRAQGQDWTANRDNNFCSLLWASTMAPICGMHPQLCGLCAVAQEAREIESVLLPSSYRRVDYITLQSVQDYYPAIYRDKCQAISADAAADATASNSNASNRPDSSGGASTSRWSLHLPPLSRLSIRLLQGWAILMAVVLVWSLIGPFYWKNIVRSNVQHKAFTWANYLVFVSTWLQAAGLLAFFISAANNPKYSELSIDAMIKFFASGFILSTSLAVFWEIIVSLVLKVLVYLSLAIAGVDVMVNPDGYTLNFISGLAGFASTAVAAPLLLADSSGAEHHDYLKVFGNSHPIFYTIYLLIDAFIMAALVEELCKYFGYRMVEHPDFFSKQDLEESARVVYGESNDNDSNDDEEVQRQRRERPSYSNQRTSLQAQGAAITIAMICVAMGFTCCENLVYIFIYNGSSLELEVWVLIVRTFFPVHALTAAIQSLGVCERDLESSRTTKLGMIIWPAILLHGGYDFIIMWIDFLYDRSQGADDGNDALESNAFWELLLAFGLSVLCMVMAFVYYLKRSRKQRERLMAMDRQEAATRSRLI